MNPNHEKYEKITIIDQNKQKVKVLIENRYQPCELWIDGNQKNKTQIQAMIEKLDNCLNQPPEDQIIYIYLADTKLNEQRAIKINQCLKNWVESGFLYDKAS